MLKLLTITLMALVLSISANEENPHSEKPTNTADTTSAKRVLVSPKTNFTLSSSTSNGLNSTVVLELWSERMISGKVVPPAAHRLLDEHMESAPVAAAMSYTYRMNGKIYINDQNLYKNGNTGIVQYQVRIGMFDKTYTTLNGPLTKDSTPPIDWSVINYDATYKNDKGQWYCNDKSTTLTDYALPLNNATFPKWQIQGTVDDKQNCVIVKSFNTKNIVDDSHLFLQTQFNKLFDTSDPDQDVKLWPGMPITIVTQVGKDLSPKGQISPFQQFDYQFTDFAIYDHVEHDSGGVTLIIILLFAGSFCIIGTCYFLDNRKK